MAGRKGRSGRKKAGETDAMKLYRVSTAHLLKIFPTMSDADKVKVGLSMLAKMSPAEDKAKLEAEREKKLVDALRLLVSQQLAGGNGPEKREQQVGVEEQGGQEDRELLQQGSGVDEAEGDKLLQDPGQLEGSEELNEAEDQSKLQSEAGDASIGSLTELSELPGEAEQ